MDHGGGMMSDDDMAALDSATGVEASRLFLTQMIEHHQGAIDMAKIELQYGKDPEVRKMAEKIIADQEKEIAEMKAWLAKSGK